MKQSDRDLNEAVLGGILVFSVVFLSMKNLVSPENQGIFSMLILVYLFASICRIFGIILESENINNFSIYYCRLFLIAFTVWATTSIILTEIKLFNTGFISFLSSYFFIITELSILTSMYGIKLRSPIVFDSNEKKFKKN